MNPEIDEHAPPRDRFWAKFSRDGDAPRWHPLIAHSADVAAVFSTMLASGTPFERALGATLGQRDLRPGQRARLVFLAAMHDMGKTSHAFQSRGRNPTEPVRWPDRVRGHVKVLLESSSVPEVRNAIHGQVLAPLGGRPQDAAELWATAVCHHGRPWGVGIEPGRRALWLADASRDPISEITRLSLHAQRWSSLEAEADDALLVTAGFTHLFAGLLTLADWIGSTLSAFPFAPSADRDPDRYWTDEALPKAAEACARIGLIPRTRTTVEGRAGRDLLPAIFPALVGDPSAKPTELQAYAATMPLPEPGTRILIESETGSGKTEAALLLYARLRDAGLVSGLMFALPTRVTATAMETRVANAIGAIYRDGESPTTALAVGGQQPRLRGSAPMMTEPGQLWDELQGRLESWAASHSKKFLAAEIVIGTLDQALLAAFPVKHAHLRLAALARHLLVVDELHSFDRYMVEALATLTAQHTAAGGIVVFMSATVSDALRRRLGGGGETTLSVAEQLPYPAFASCRQPGTGWTDHAVGGSGVNKAVAWSCVTQDEAWTSAAHASRSGARVLVLCNTVRRSREVVVGLRERGCGALLWSPSEARHSPPFHSRYTPADRRVLDAEVIRRFGKAAALATGGVILVSTQVLEQSLDVDFDLLITDLCPVDVLLQRIGRLHRHRQRDSVRPDCCSAARTLVIGPEDGFTPLLFRRSIELGWGQDRPYPNYAHGELTLRTIIRHPTIRIPDDNRRLVESVYHPEAREALWQEPDWDLYLPSAEGKELNEAWQGEQAVLQFDQTYLKASEQYNGAAHGSIRTRLGDETVRVRLTQPVRNWYLDAGEETEYVDLPLWALPKLDEALDEPVAEFWPEMDGTPRYRLKDRWYRYSAMGWEWGRI